MVIPSNPDWDESRTGWQLGGDQRPVAVVRARSAGDVVATVRAAVAAGVRVAPQATGRNALPLGPLTDTVLLRTSDMRGVEIDPVCRVARVEAGAVWGEVTEAAAAHGLAGLMGTARDVGVVGYTPVSSSKEVFPTPGSPGPPVVRSGRPSSVRCPIGHDRLPLRLPALRFTRSGRRLRIWTMRRAGRAFRALATLRRCR